jgi:predicted dehydrogenase
MPRSALLNLSRRSAIRAGGLSAVSMLVARATAPASAQPAHPIDQGNVSDGKVKFPPIAASSEASQPEEDPPLAPRDRVGFAVVALGRLSLEQILPAFAQTKKCKLTALVSGTPDKLKAVGAQYGIPSEKLYSYESFDRIGQDDAVQVVFIVLPNSMHREYVLRTASAKKHVLCEKPMATSSADAQAMIDACAEARVKLMIAYRCRYQPHHLEIIKRAQSGALGPIKLIEAINAQNQGDPAQWRLRKALAGGGALPDVGIYCLNAARAVTGEEPLEIEAQLHATPGDVRFREVEESVTWLMRFPSGALANLSTSYGIHRASRMAVNLDGGTLVLENAFPYKGQRLLQVRAQDKLETESVIQIGPKDHFATEMDHMADCVLKNETPRTPGEEGLRDMKLMEAIYRAAESRTSIKV